MAGIEAYLGPGHLEAVLRAIVALAEVGVVSGSHRQCGTVCLDRNHLALTAHRHLECVVHSSESN